MFGVISFILRSLQKKLTFYNEPIEETHCKKQILRLEGIRSTFSAQRCSKPIASKQFGKWCYLISSNHGLTILLELSNELVLLLRVPWNKRFPIFSSPQTTFNAYMYIDTFRILDAHHPSGKSSRAMI
jgi:hypothetical protein